jgi:hypothetical protein
MEPDFNMDAPGNSNPATLRFVRRFRNGTLCEMTIHLHANGTPCHSPNYVWKGSVPRLRGERLIWELSCFRAVAERIKSPTFYGACLSSGEIKAWRCDPGKRPKRIPFSELVEDGAIIIAAQNSDDHGNTWPR